MARKVEVSRSVRQRILRDEMRRLGAKGGKVPSEARAEAARRNGRLGGRPRKERS